METLTAALRAPEGIALFLDMDGTLIDFAATPDAVRVPSDLSAALQAAARRVDGALALLSGRSIAELDRLTAPLQLPAGGLHGGEIRAHPGGVGHRAAGNMLPVRLIPDLRDLLLAFPETLLEDKDISVAVHYRNTPAVGPELGAAIQRYMDACGGADVEIMEGELVYEIKPAGFDKGRALLHFMKFPPFVGRRPVFISDHPIDQAGFDSAASLGGLGVSVGRELPGTVACFPNTAALRAWLRGLEGEQPSSPAVAA